MGLQVLTIYINRLNKFKATYGIVQFT